MISKKRKGQAIGLTDIPNIVLILIIIGIVLAFGAMFLVEMRDVADAHADTNSSRTTVLGIMNDSLEGLETLGEWQPTIAVAVIIAVALAIVIGLFAFRRQGGL